MGIGSKIKDAKRIFSQDGSFEAVNSRISNLETHEYKITYYEVVSGTSGTLTVPSQGTINADEFGLSGNAILSKIDVNGKPTFESPVTSGGSPVTASLNVLTGAWVASGTYTDTNVALIYSIKINALYYDNLVYNNIIETVKVTADVGTTTLQSVTDAGNTTTNTIETAGYVKTGGTSSQFLKADGTVDSSVYITSSALTPYLTTASAALTYFPIPTGTTSQYLRGDGTLATFPTIPSGTVTSVDLTMPSAFTVSGNPVTNSGTLAVTGAGVVSQYIRGDGTLANFPTSTGGGSSVSYYLNGSVAQGTIGGIAFKEVNKTPVIGAGTDFTINANGYIQSFITDANDPNQLTIPAGNWNFETYFSASSGGGSPSFYVELYKWDGTTLTLIASNSATPEYITNGTAIDLYITALTVPQTTLTVTDRLAIRIYVTHSSKTITLHTEDNHLCQIITTFSTGLTALNGLTAQVQSFGNDTNVTMVSSGSTHTLTWAGTLADSRIASAATWNAKQNALSGTGFVKSTAGVISYDTNTYLTTTNAASTYVPYTGATANVNLGTFTLTTPTINGVSGLLSFGSTDRVSVGNYATPSAQRIFTVGQDTSWASMGSCSDFTSFFGLSFNQTAPTTANSILIGNVNTSSLQATGNVTLRANAVYAVSCNSGTLALLTNALASGAVTSFSITKPNNTGQTLGTSIAGWNYVGGSRQWATGAITTQSENVWGATTYSFVGASTITNAYGNVFNAPIAGTNATITNNYAAQFNGKVEANLGLETNTLAGLNTASANLLIVSNNTATKGYILIGNNSAETVYFQSQQFGFSSTVFFTPLSATGFSISRVTPSDTIPNFVMNRSDLGTGIGGTINTISLITASTTKVKLFNNGNLLIQSGGTFTDNGFKLEVVGTGRFTNTLRVTNNLIAGFNTTPLTGTISDGVTSVLGNLQNFTTNYHSGEVLYSEVSGEALNFGQLCYRNAAGKWQKATGSSAAIAAYNMLGICLQTVAGTDTAISILTRGYVESTYLSAGAVGNPLFMSATTSGSITNTAPSTAGNIVRLIGNVFWSSALQTNAKWILYFNPDNTWIEL